VQQLRSQFEAANAKNSRLEQQLQGLTDEKHAAENALLQKFADLLNSKKLKIRDLQRLLAGAKVDPTVGTCPILPLLTRPLDYL
jgi:DNA double-strand break repair and V(D)J recombination protein XRCC4